MTIKSITRIPLFTALIIVSTIIIPPIPVAILGINVTLQTLVVMLAGLLLSPIDAFISMLLYLIIGALGYPVFSGLKGGMGIILGPSGGFLISFPIAACLISYFNRYNSSLFKTLIINLIFGIILIYLIGSLWLDYYIAKSFSKILLGMLIFIPGDIIKVIVASIIGHKINQRNIYK